MRLLKMLATLCWVTLLINCGGSGANTGTPTNNQQDIQVPIGQEESPTSLQKIKINQIGYLPLGEKIAIVPNIDVDIFSLISVDTNETVFEGTLTEALNWPVAGSEKHKQANFSAFTQSGNYIIRVQGIVDSMPFAINDGIYSEILRSALKSYYFNRASIDIIQPYAESWPRIAGHNDVSVLVHSSAASTNTPSGTALSASKGWYDAGDYGKYVVNSGISTYTLMATFEQQADLYKNLSLNIPESNDQLPDIFNEILWNLAWLEKMQDNDGGVFHKLTTLDWPGIEMPQEDNRDRYVIGKSTAATLNYAAVFAMASRIANQYQEQLPGKSEQWLISAKNAWQWANNNPSQYYQQPSDVQSGEYGDNVLTDEFSWAAAELFLSTNDNEYYLQYQQYAANITVDVPNWRNVGYLALSSLLRSGEMLITTEDFIQLKAKQKTLAEKIHTEHIQSSYLTAMTISDFVWGSNSVAMNKAYVLLEGYNIHQDIRYKNAASGLLDYILGKNPTDYSFVTGFGDLTPIAPHHRISEADAVDAPIPGMLVGGPNPGQQDSCKYPNNAPAKSYLDDWCSFASNEIAINWTAPLVYVLASF